MGLHHTQTILARCPSQHSVYALYMQLSIPSEECGVQKQKKYNSGSGGVVRIDHLCTSV